MNFNKKLNIFLNLINKSKNILLINHTRMDWDAYWSTSAFYKIMKKLWKNITFINEEWFLNKFNFIKYDIEIKNKIDKKKFNYDLIISFDAGSEEQLWDIFLKNKGLFYSKDFIVIDHHETNTWFWKINLIKKESSSTCEFLFEIIKELNFKKYIDKDIATLLLTWIITDTNIFYNRNTNSQTLLNAGELMWLWADSKLPIFNFFRKRNFNKTKLWWEILKDIKKTDNSKIVWGLVKDKYLKKTNTIKDDLNWLINEFLANIEWAEVCFLLYQINQNSVKASLRSNNIDVAKIASIFWWWWHKLAAWFIKKDNIKTIEKELLNILKKEI